MTSSIVRPLELLADYGVPLHDAERAGPAPEDLDWKGLVPPVPADSAETPADRLARLGARTLGQIPTAPPPPLLGGRLDPFGHTILYGPGGVGKGTLAVRWAADLVAAGQRVVILDYENHPEEWSRRYRDLVGDAGRDDILHVAPLASGWRGPKGPLWEHAGEIRRLCADFGATLAFIDSIVVACGGTDPLESGSPARYAGALEAIGLPALSLGHVTKDMSLEYPFGSVFWHNLARVTWSLARQDGQRAILANRKANNYGRAGKFVVETTWHEGCLREVTELDYSASIAMRIEAFLGDAAKTDDEIVVGINAELDDDEPRMKKESIQTALRRGLKHKPPRFRFDDGQWRRA